MMSLRRGVPRKRPRPLMSCAVLTRPVLVLSNVSGKNVKSCGSMSSSVRIFLTSSSCCMTNSSSDLGNEKFLKTSLSIVSESGSPFGSCFNNTRNSFTTFLHQRSLSLSLSCILRAVLAEAYSMILSINTALIMLKSPTEAMKTKQLSIKLVMAPTPPCASKMGVPLVVLQSPKLQRNVVSIERDREEKYHSTPLSSPVGSCPGIGPKLVRKTSAIT
mmetsp:Transcript_23081/g.44238  ORF Transcript_23081/g.44238 Transcript_23081/m.44238 type:complete len:217 (-) Transcript_23081:381-1031(-)